MNTIDQRILIPASPEVVWAYLSDLTRNPSWQADCKNVSFLTSKREGPATRWRYSTGRNREQVAEISAWYNGLGYEYTIIDGAPFRKNTGRIRLQEIPEGTIVQWTFSYEVGGLLGGGRSVGRQVETMMETSLKNLWRRITQASSGKTAHEAKSLMRDAPDVEARMQYKPRHPSVSKDDAVPEPHPIFERRPAEKPSLIIEDEIGIDDLGVARFQPPVVIPEPPIVEGDTRPRPPVPAPEHEQYQPPSDVEEPDFLASLAPATTPEPDFLQSLDAPTSITDAPIRQEPPVVEDDTRPRPAVTSAPPVQADVEAREIVPASADPLPAPPTESSAPPAPENLEARASSDIPPLSPEPATTNSAEDKSIWEIFGLPRPSETGEMKAVTPEADTPPTEAVPAQYPHVEIASEAPRPYIGELPSAGRVGLRLRVRRKLVRLRRPS